MLLPRFGFHEPETVEEACRLLRAHGEAASVYAGGTELLLAMKLRLLRYERLVDIKRIPGLDAIRRQDGALVIGALATHDAIERSAEVRGALPALARMARQVGNIRIRSAGTLGGNLCFAEPHADPPALLAALGARLKLEGLDGVREVGIEEFCLGAYETARRWDELLTAIVVPVPAEGTGITYQRFAFVERPAVGVGALLRLGPARRLDEVRVVVGAVGFRPARAGAAEAALAGRPADEVPARLDEAARLAADEVQVVADRHGSEDYKRHLVEVHVRRALREALARAAGPEAR